MTAIRILQLLAYSALLVWTTKSWGAYFMFASLLIYLIYALLKTMRF
jgi:hypothetical protein